VVIQKLCEREIEEILPYIIFEMLSFIPTRFCLLFFIEGKLVCSLLVFR
jgi:hypothetical protein